MALRNLYRDQEGLFGEEKKPNSKISCHSPCNAIIIQILKILIKVSLIN